MCSATSIPSMGPWMRMSMSTKSGLTASTCARVSGPLAAMPTTWYPSLSSMRLRSSATIRSSSTTNMRSLDTFLSSLVSAGILQFLKSDDELRPVLALDAHAALELLGEDVHQPQAQGGRVPPVEAVRQADAFVGHRELV